VVLDCGGKPLDLSTPVVMGVLNVTPDSFSDGGRFAAVDAALEHARRMVADGAAIIDVGGESTRPGAADVPVDEELRRVMPIIEALAPELPVPISVDTTKPEVMRAAAAAGAGMLNDVTGLSDPRSLEVAADSGLAVCVMHMQGTPRTMQKDPRYADVVADIHAYLAARLAACESVGIRRERIVIDPGFGFGKSMAHNAKLLHQLGRFGDLGVPVLAGLSRKSFLGNIIDRPADERLHASVAAAVLAAWNGASIIRAHDVGPTVQALAVAAYVRRHGVV
jgi:dihydropteroate synthase